MHSLFEDVIGLSWNCKKPACLGSATCGFRYVVGRHHAGRANLLLPITAIEALIKKKFFSLPPELAAEVHGGNGSNGLTRCLADAASCLVYGVYNSASVLPTDNTLPLGSNVAVRHEVCSRETVVAQVFVEGS